MAVIQNLETYNPFSDEGVDEYQKIVADTRLDIRTQQRTKWKRITICQGLPVELNCRKVVRALKKSLSCNVWSETSEEYGQIIQLHGDFTDQLIDFFTTTGLCDRKNIKVHGV